MKGEGVEIIDDMREHVATLARVRVPWLMAGLLGGLAASVVVSRFESTLTENIALAFFLPVIVYMSDAVGTQTEVIFVRKLTTGRVRFWRYILKEMFLGMVLGAILGGAAGAAAGIWIGSANIALIVGIAMAVNIALAPAVALVVPEVLFKEKMDPALGAGPLTTVVQDLISVAVYLGVASVIGK